MAEIKRLLYVGVTRAKEHLIISFESNEDLKIQHGSFIWMLQKGLDVDFDNDLFITQENLTFLINEGGNYFNKEKIVPDRKSTRLNSSHLGISYAVFCLKKKNNR